MNKHLLIALSALVMLAAPAVSMTAQAPKSFTTIKELPITSVKNQYRSGTCWDYATLGYFESEILRKSGKAYDHVMLIYGKAVDEAGKPYYLVKNSWGTESPYGGTWYMSRDYIALNTTYIFLNREALDGKLSWVNPADYQSSNQENMQKVRDFLHKTGYYFLATANGDQPEVRPFGTAEIIEGKLYIQTGHVKAVAKQIAANPKIAICAFDAGSGEWLRIKATLVEDPRVEVKKAMLDANPSLRSMYDENDGNTAVYFLKDAKATISSFTHEPVEIDF